MKNSLTMQKGKDLFAHAEFNSAFNHFLEHGNSGLMLVSVPTGVGKTTQAKLYICNHYSEKTFFYVTPLNKNVKKAFEETRDLFEDVGLLDEFNKRAIYLQSNLDMFEENISNVKSFLDETIIELPSFQKLIRKQNSDKLDSDEKEEKTKLESQFRSELRALLVKQFNTKDSKELILKISDSETFRPLLSLYPSIKSSEKNIFFLSVDKLYVGNTPIVETHYDFVRSKMMDGAVVFLDEFDSTKEKLLGKMIEEASEGSIDLPQLFRDINDKIRGDAPSINREMLECIPGKPEKKTSVYAFESTQSVFLDRVKKYNLDKKFKYDGAVDSQYFILSDWSTPVVAEIGKKESPSLYVSFNEKGFNSISDKEGNIKLTSVFKPLSGAIEYFINALKLISGNEYELRKSKRNGEIVTIYDCVDSVLNNFDFESYGEQWSYVSPLINNKLRNKDDNIRKNKFEIDFYSSGFDYVSISNDIQSAHSSRIDCISLHSTPEDYLVHLAQKAYVIGLSATAEFNTVTGNYDMNYVRRKLSSLSYTIPDDDQKTIDDYIQKRLSENKSTPVPLELHASKGNSYELEDIFGDDAEHYASELRRTEFQCSKDSEINENNCRRFSKILKSILHFVNNSEGKVLLVLSNRNVGNGTHKIDKYKSFCKAAEADISNIEFISLTSKTWTEDIKKYETAILQNKKVVLFTSYQAASTGQNLQFIEKLDEFEREKDIDSIYIEYPTHQIVLNEKALSKEQKIEAVYQIEALSEYGMLAKKKRKPLIKAYLSGCYSSYQNDMYYCKSTNAHILKTLCQAIGRVSRTQGKEGTAYIYIDEDIVSKVDVSLLRGKVYTKEFEAFLEYIHSVKTSDKVIAEEDIERINIAENSNEKAVQMINDFIGDWGEFELPEIDAWKALRVFSAVHPTASSELMKENPHYQRFYLQCSTKGPINNYFYSGQNDHIDSISYIQTEDAYYQVSDENACLSYLCRNDVLAKAFAKAQMPIVWESNEYIILPTIYRNIYRGALGEQCVKALLEHYGILLKEIDDPKRFERFDFVIDGNEDIGIDAKFWSLSSATATSEDLSKAVEIEKIIRKMNDANFTKGIIINLLCKNADSSLRKPHIEGDGRVLVIPSLINPDSIDASDDEEAISAICDFLEDAKNGK